MQMSAATAASRNKTLYNYLPLRGLHLVEMHEFTNRANAEANASNNGNKEKDNIRRKKCHRIIQKKVKG